MINAVLYFPDAINLKAFVLVEKLGHAKLNTIESTLKAQLNPTQLEKAQLVYGAILRQSNG